MNEDWRPPIGRKVMIQSGTWQHFTGTVIKHDTWYDQPAVIVEILSSEFPNGRLQIFTANEQRIRAL